VDSLDAAAVWRRRLWRYVPLLLWVGFILCASTGTLSASNTSRVVRPLLLWLMPGISEEGLWWAHFVVRKSAHFTEYAILALLAARAFLSSSRSLLRRRSYTVALLLVTCCALLDEYHQSFFATRSGAIFDCLIDITGGAAALALLWRARREQSPVEDSL